MQCPKCHAEVRQEAQFCWQCGTALQEGQTPRAVPPVAVPPSGKIRWVLPACTAVVVLAVVALLLLHGMGAKNQVTSTPVANATQPSQALTASTPGNQTLPQSTPVTSATPGNFATGPALPQGTAKPVDPNREDVAAYLRKLEAIQLRDQQSTPIMQLTALAGAGLNAFSAQMRDLEGDAPATQNRNQQGPDYNAIFIHILQQKQLICRDFQAITPVPAPCMLLHKAYGAYLVATVRAIGQIQAAARDATNPAAVFSALPIGQAADTAHSYADGIENQVRSRYGIPRSTGSIVP